MDHGHDEHAHGGGPAAHGGHHPPEAEAPTPPHVFTIARLARQAGLALLLAGLAGAAYYEVVRPPEQCGRAAWSGFLALYGFCIARAAADTLRREGAGGASGAH